MPSICAVFLFLPHFLFSRYNSAFHAFVQVSSRRECKILDYCLFWDIQTLSRDDLRSQWLKGWWPTWTRRVVTRRKRNAHVSLDPVSVFMPKLALSPRSVVNSRVSSTNQINLAVDDDEEQASYCPSTKRKKNESKNSLEISDIIRPLFCPSTVCISSFNKISPRIEEKARNKNKQPVVTQIFPKIFVPHCST
jgi:hypothetical protein